MSHLDLNSCDYQNLLGFASKIHDLEEYYFDGILYLLDEIFNWNLTFYYMLDVNDDLATPKVNLIKSLNIQHGYLQKCIHVYYDEDIIYKMIKRQRMANKWTGVYYYRK